LGPVEVLHAPPVAGGVAQTPPVQAAPRRQSAYDAELHAAPGALTVYALHVPDVALEQRTDARVSHEGLAVELPHAVPAVVGAAVHTLDVLQK
jgi:hypothetical protein